MIGKESVKTKGINQKHDHDNCTNTITATAKNKEGIAVDRRNNSSMCSKDGQVIQKKNPSNSFRVKVMMFFSGVWKGCGMMEVF